MEIYKSEIDGNIYSEYDLNNIISKLDTLTSDNWEYEFQNLIDNLQLELLKIKE